jgi:uncharacterized protein YjbI with pentapeptide repeats
VGAWRIWYGVIAIAAGSVVVALTVLAYRRHWHWTGLTADPGDGTSTRPARPAKTLWDWLQLLIVPLVLAVLAFGLNAEQGARERRQEDRRADRERAGAEERASDETLRSYLLQMSQLMLDSSLASEATRRRSGGATRDAVTVARTMTLTTLRRLDGVRKGLVIQFLWEAGLIDSRWLYSSQATYGTPIFESTKGSKISLVGADLRHLDLHGQEMGTASAGARYITGRPAYDFAFEVRGVNLEGADLRYADLGEARLIGANLELSDLRGADLSGAHLGGARFEGSCLTQARFVGAHLLSEGPDSPHWPRPAEIEDAAGINVDFSRADLSGVDFRRSALSKVTLHGAEAIRTRFPQQWTPIGATGPFSDVARLCRATPIGSPFARRRP